MNYKPIMTRKVFEELVATGELSRNDEILYYIVENDTVAMSWKNENAVQEIEESLNSTWMQRKYSRNKRK